MTRQHLPLLLIYFRVGLGLVLFGLSFCAFPAYGELAVALLSLGLLSDILDGIIARRLGVSSARLRRLDSNADQLFWCLVAGSAFVQHPQFFYDYYPQLLLLLGLELLTYLISFARFGKEVATHTLAAKAWTLTLFATLVQLLLTGNAHGLFPLCFYLGLLSRLEIAAILLTLKTWANDVPTVYHAVKLRRGLAINRNKLFNG